METRRGVGAVVAGLRERLLDLLFTPRCVGCSREGGYLCGPCLEGVGRLANPIALEDLPAVTPALEDVYAPFVFEGAIRDAVHQLKYRGLQAVAPDLGKLLSSHARRNQLAADVLVPVPLHSRRLRQRGYNQAELLARETGARLGVEVMTGVLSRTRHESPQAGASSVRERLAHVKGAFQARGPVEGRSVLLIDDVCTTGATLGACAVALRAAGAVTVRALTLAEGL